MVKTEKKPSIGKSIRKGIETVGSFVSTVRKTLHNMRPKRKYSDTAFVGIKKSENTSYIKPPESKHMPRHGGKKSSKKTKRNMRKRGTQKRR